MENQETLQIFNDHSEMEMAGFGPRWGALLVDANILLIVIILFFRSVIPMLRSGDFEPSELSDSFLIGGVFMYFFGLPLIGILYQSIFECTKFQGTPGKIAVKIKVVNKHGERVSFLQAFGRNSGKILSALILYIGFFMAIWTDKKQALHDQMANTYVVLKR
jgi:uncharacterized RDD family membrane protein YckC